MFSASSFTFATLSFSIDIVCLLFLSDIYQVETCEDLRIWILYMLDVLL